ncbi:MAG TPA: S8 family serine peptidase [Gaiellaceae bacterium]|nr:S8 family serine peptidase [Gaiellaceae bacterium]
MPTRRRPELARASALAAVAAISAFLLAGNVQGARETVTGAAVRAWHSIFGDRPEQGQATGSRMIVVLSSPPLADRVEAASTKAGPRLQREWVADIEAEQDALLASLRERGIRIDREEIFTKTLNGFSATLDARAVAELDRNPSVVGLYPVRAVYPAEAETSRPRIGTAAGVSLPGFDGRGETVALLDTGVDLNHSALSGRLRRGIDVVGHDRRPAARVDPGDAAAVEAHGTRMAGIVAAVAPGAKIRPIRVVGWQRAPDGTASLVGRGDQLIAGLERAVDPNGDGSVKDAATVTLAALAEPFAAFPDSPEARAVAGATKLGTLVVAAAGNDGSSGIGFGSIGGPGGAPEALTVGAVDTRRSVRLAALGLRAGDDELVDGPVRLLGQTAPSRPATLAVAALLGPSLASPSRPAGSEADASSLGDFFDANGVSRVAGRAALVLADGAPLELKARNAKAAGAAALLVSGTALPAGALDLEEATALPVLALPGNTGAAALDALRSGKSVTARLAPGGSVSNDGFDRVASFSSGGLAFDGRTKPDVVAPGVGLATVDPGPGGGSSRATVSGSSAAAAVAAGVSILVAQARAGLTASELHSLLVGSAGPLGGDQPVTREGAGAIDPVAASTAELALEPATVSFGRAAGPDWTSSQTVTVRNVSSRPLEVGFGVVPDEPGAARVSFTAEPAHLSLGPGASRRVEIQVTATAGFGDGASGVLVAAAPGARAARAPWAIARRPAASDPLVDSVSLSNWEFAASKDAPAVLAFRAGRAVAGGEGERIEPVGLLDLELWTPKGKRLGVIARLRDLLPGRYAFGLTGRGPDGRLLRPGTYVLRLRAQPVDAADGSPPSTADIAFRIRND